MMCNEKTEGDVGMASVDVCEREKPKTAEEAGGAGEPTKSHAKGVLG